MCGPDPFLITYVFLWQDVLSFALAVCYTVFNLARWSVRCYKEVSS
jgi:hypothetical protein